MRFVQHYSWIGSATIAWVKLIENDFPRTEGEGVMVAGFRNAAENPCRTRMEDDSVFNAWPGITGVGLPDPMRMQLEWHSNNVPIPPTTKPINDHAATPVSVDPVMGDRQGFGRQQAFSAVIC